MKDEIYWHNAHDVTRTSRVEVEREELTLAWIAKHKPHPKAVVSSVVDDPGAPFVVVHFSWTETREDRRAASKSGRLGE